MKCQLCNGLHSPTECPVYFGTKISEQKSLEDSTTTSLQATPEELQVHAVRLKIVKQNLDLLQNLSGMQRSECLLIALTGETQRTNGLLQSITELLTKSSTASPASDPLPAPSSNLSTLQAAWDAATPGELRALFSLEGKGSKRLHKIPGFLCLPELQYLDKLMRPIVN